MGYLADWGLGEEGGGFGEEDGAGLGVGVIGEVLVDEEGDLDGSDGALAEILGLLGFRFRHF